MYKIDNLWQQSITVMTNSYKYSSFRCTEHPNNTLAREPLIDRAAYAIGMNPLDFRLKNLNLEANPDTKQPYNNSGLQEVIQQATDQGGLDAEVARAEGQGSSPGRVPRHRHGRALVLRTALAARRRRAW